MILAFVLSLFLFSTEAETLGGNEQLEVGTLLLEWEPVEGATSYSLRFVSDEGKRLSFESKTSRFESQLPSGRYKFQIRSHDKNGPGPWSEAVSVNVEKLDTLNLSPGDQAVLDYASSKTAKVDFRWRSVADTRFYYFMINGDKGFRKRVRTEKTELHLELPRSQTYTWKTIPVQKSGAVHETQGKPFQFYIRGLKLKTPLLTEEIPPHSPHIKWEPVKGAEAYALKLSYRPLLETQWRVQLESVHRETLYALKEALKPGEYKIEVKALSKKAPYSGTDQKTFVIKPKLAELSQR